MKGKKIAAVFLTLLMLCAGTVSFAFAEEASMTVEPIAEEIFLEEFISEEEPTDYAEPEEKEITLIESNVAEPVAEEPVEEPIAEEPFVAEPNVEEPAEAEPDVEQPTEETSKTEPVVEPIVEDPVAEEPAEEKIPTEEIPEEEPTAEEPTAEETVVEQPSEAETNVEQPTEETSETEPVAEPNVEETTDAEPIVEKPAEETAKDPAEDPENIDSEEPAAETEIKEIQNEVKKEEDKAPEEAPVSENNIEEEPPVENTPPAEELIPVPENAEPGLTGKDNGLKKVADFFGADGSVKSIAVGDSADLNEFVRSLGYTGEISSIVSSNPNVLDVVDGKLVVKDAFGDETLTLVIDGREVVIKAHDPVGKKGVLTADDLLKVVDGITKDPETGEQYDALHLLDNIEVANGAIIIKRNFTIDLNGFALIGTGTGSVLTVNSGAEFTLVDSENSSAGTHKGYTDANGLWHLGDIPSGKENSCTEKDITGGIITGGNTFGRGGGVCVENGGKFIMTSGRISGNNTANSGGGVYSGGTFIMESGSISGNTADLYGGGVSLISSTFTMNGGRITGNIAQGGLSITDNRAYGGGGGVNLSSSTFTMNGGEISDNITESYGGGVCVFTGTFTLNSGMINHNTAKQSGGGVATINVSTYIMNGGTITGNTAEQNGGGVYNFGHWEMSKGEVMYNKAINGGGIYLAKGEAQWFQQVWINSFAMTGGTITQNTASQAGGVYCQGEMVVGGASKVTGNVIDGRITNNTDGTFTLAGGTRNNLWLPKGETVVIGDVMEKNSNGVVSPAEGMEIWASLEAVPTLDAPVAVASATMYSALSFLEYSEFFHSDNADYGVGIGFADDLRPFKVVFGIPVAEVEDGDNTGKYLSVNNAITAIGIGDSTEAKSGTIKMLNDGTGNITIKQYQNITIDLNGHILNGYGDDSVITINGGELTIKDRNPTAEHTGYNIKGGIITGGKGKSFNGLSYGGGVYINGGSFNLEKGTIIDNNARYGGGVYVFGTFTMTGGAIRQCQASSGCGGGVYVTSWDPLNKFSRGTFIMTGGEIRDCSANSGGGVYLEESSIFTLNDGIIRDNYAMYCGGGVSTRFDSSFTMNGGEIRVCSAPDGGGVYLDYSALLNMTNGMISGNSANTGGGVFNNSTFTITGGEITRNTASKAGGVYSQGIMNVGDTAKVTGNVIHGTIMNNPDGTITLFGGTGNNIYLPVGKTVSVGKDQTMPTENMLIGVTLENGTGNVTGKNATDYSRYFASDNTEYVLINRNGIVQLCRPVVVPSAVTGLVYNGKEHTGVNTGPNYTLEGNTAINAGEYTAIAKLAEGYYCWYDGTTDVRTISWSIERKQLSVNGTVIENKTYDGTVFCSVSDPGKLIGLIPGNDVTFTASSAFPNSIAGSYEVIVSYQLSGNDAGNYLAPADNRLTATITARNLDASAVTDIEAVEYSGREQKPEVVIKDGEKTLIAGMDYEVEYSDNVNAGAATVTVNFKGNYAGKVSKDFQILPKPITVTGTTIENSKVYDGDADVKVTANGVLDIISGDDVQFDSVSAAYEDRNVGTGKTVKVVYTIKGGDAGNYLAPNEVTLYADITAKQLFVTDTTVDNKCYDGTADAAVTLGTVSGVIPGDDVAVVVTGTFDTAEIGTGKEVTVEYGLFGKSAMNYIVPTTEKLTASIVEKSSVNYEKPAAVAAVSAVLVYVDSELLTEGVDYNWVNGKIMFTADFLNTTLKEGEHVLTIKFPGNTVNETFSFAEGKVIPSEDAKYLTA